MRELARFVMKGPGQASGVALVSTLVPMMFWVGAATVALVTLRLGASKGLSVFLWALAPALAWWFGLQDPTALVVLLSTFVMAEVLRRSISLRRTMLIGFGCSVLIGLLAPMLFSEAIDKMMLLTEEVLKQLATDAEIEVDDQIRAGFQSLLIASFAASFYLMSVGSLFLARYWQSALFNPEGWRREFHELRLDPTALFIVIGSGFLGPLVGIDSYLLVFSAMVLFSVCGFALVHGLIGKKNLGGQWLFGFYMMVIVLFPMSQLFVAIAAIMDSAADFRSRVQSYPK